MTIRKKVSDENEANENPTASALEAPQNLSANPPGPSKPPNQILNDNIVIGTPTHSYVPPPSPPSTETAKAEAEQAAPDKAEE